MTAAEEATTVRKIGRYEVVRKIATGGMAELFLARFVGPGGFEKRCALKRILPQFAADKTFTKMFVTEARVTAMFDHPNLVQIFELGQDDEGQFFIAMELVNGLNLRQLLHMCKERGVKIPPELCAYMVTQALDGLAYAHEFKDESGRPLNLVHRDVSPQNILVSYEGAVKVVDFGIVKGNSISSETQAGMLKGKVAYMSPEQASGDPIDARSDIFSIGVCLYELIAGEKPFTGPNEIMCLKAILEEEPIPLYDFAPDVPEEIEAIIYRALMKEREERWFSARQFQIELQEVLKSCPTPLGRHTIAEFVKSFTEAGTKHFDVSKVRIPRTNPGNEGSGPRGVRFASSHSSVPLAEPQSDPTPPPASLSSGPKPLPHVPRTISSSPSRPADSPLALPRNVSRSNPGIDSGLSPTPVGSLSENTGLTRELSAAGVGKRMNPMIMLVFAASALAGGLAVYLVTRDDNTVVVEVPATPPEPPKTAVAAAVVKEPEPPPAPVKEPEPPPAPVKAPEPPPPAPPPVAKTTPAKKKEVRSEPKVSNGGTLTLTSIPRGLTVLLENDSLGKTPLVGTVLPAGTHTLTLVHKTLGISKKMQVKIVKGAATAETITVGKGTLKVNSRPWSEVYVDGVSKGKTPLEFPVYEGIHEVRAVSPEAGERIQKIEIKDGQTEDLRIKF